MEKGERSLGEAINELRSKVAELSNFVEIYSIATRNSIMFNLDRKGDFISAKKGDSPLREIEGKSFLSVLKEGERKKAAENFMRCLEGERVSTSVETKDGKTFNVVAMPTTDAGTEGIQGIAMEETRRGEFEELFDAIGEAMCISDLLGNIEMANRPFSSLLGYENIKSKNIFDFIDDASSPEIREGVREALAGRRQKKEAYVVAADRTKIPVEIEISEVNGMELLFRITETRYRNRIEREIEEISEKKDERLQDFKEKLSMISELDGKTSLQDLYDAAIRTIMKFFDANSCFIGMFSEGEFNIVAYHGDKPSDVPVDGIMEAASKNGLYEIYGEENHVYAPLSVHKKVTGAIGLKLDSELSDEDVMLLKILAMYFAKSAAYVSSEFSLKSYRETMSRAVEGMYRTTFDGKIVKVNPAFARIFGYEGREKELKKINAENLFLNPEDRKKFIGILERDGVVQHFETKYVTRNKKVIFGRESAWIINDSNEKMIEGMFQDITHEMKMEEDARFYNSLLRHDIYNKNEIAIGYIGLLKSSDLSEKERKIIDKAVRAITEGNKLIETVKKLEIIREKKEMSNINIDNIMKQVIEHYAEEARKRDIEISYEPSGAIVMGNELVEDIFSNLLKNSIEHSYGQHIKIYAKDDDEGWSIFMEDDGVGIPEEEKNKIFQQGWKGQGSTGSGLGLYLVKKIVDGFGGKIWVESGEDEYPEGCRFVVWLKKGGIATKKNRSEIIGNESRVARVRW